ncbi:xanthine dehydrogenase family protein molybdopterin-binding subunit [Bordetella petrii]|uniref:xanthine dehydrogenase family protein molybdopterin-binding subunit n=1 Tax=Bordetella petrii TaxID=94624 RepID=UPI001E5245E4|nr:xanthine dehydrogenase family protein molybdopterin-binding subunit [Bordetella petrii]MCD0504786.1 xanthine dehydrogenase family protein molybdopterin-binding subunit [Bordetella petrii]
MHSIMRSSFPAPAPVHNVSRRRFMQGAGGLVLGIALGPAAARAAGAAAASAADGAFAPNAFVRIGTDGIVTVLSKHIEMGQGAYTGLATLLAEELDADWSSIRVEGAPANTELYKNLAMGMQGTGGSTAIANSFEQMRRAGATARAMLVAAAAGQWQVDPRGITVSDGVVRHAATQRQAGFGDLAEAAAKLPVPESVTLKAPADFKLIGKETLRRVDRHAKTDGTAVFTQDFKLPGMLVAMAARPPRFGATVASFDASQAKAVPGVRHVVQFAGQAGNPGGVAVLADNTWAARTGRDALQVQWDDSKAYRKSSDDIRAQYRKALGRPGKVAASHGDIEAGLAQSAQVIEAEYEVPYVAHTAMEPMNCVVQLGEGRCDIWNGEQFQTPDQATVAKVLGLRPEQVFITQLYAGGSFGRRANPRADYLVETVAIAQAAREQGVRAPIKLVWTREDDLRAGYFRPLNVHRARVGLDAQGRLQAWHVRVAGQSIIQGTPFQAAMQGDIDPTSVEGQADLRYAVPNLQVELHTPTDVGVPVLWYRSVGHTHTAFSAEGLMDEAAAAAGQDPVAYRAALLDQHPRHRKVLELAAEQAGWSQPLAAGAPGERRGKGVAVHESFDTIVAQVAEVTVKPDGSFKVDRVVCAVDCGIVVNPDLARSQIEGGIGFGLSTALHGAVTLKDGQVEQSNFHDYLLLRINEMPAVEVHFVPSAEKPTGVGEPGVPPVAPAVANALYAATRQRIRTLPFSGQAKALAAQA